MYGSLHFCMSPYNNKNQLYQSYMINRQDSLKLQITLSLTLLFLEIETVRSGNVFIQMLTIETWTEFLDEILSRGPWYIKDDTQFSKTKINEQLNRAGEKDSI